MKPKIIRTITPTDGWDRYIKLEREQLTQRADGKMSRMIGKAQPGEDQEELDLIIHDDEFTAQSGYVPLRQGNTVWHLHIDELTSVDRWARVEYEKTLVRWLKGRVESEKSAAQLREMG